MADFDIAYSLTKGYEGGYADIPGDSGGVTYAGITRKNFPNWPGWSTVMSQPRKWNERIPSLDDLVKGFYRVHFWLPVHGDDIMDQEFANSLFDMAVNAGISAAVKLAQETTGRTKTGKLSTDDINAINGLV